MSDMLLCVSNIYLRLCLSDINS